MDESINKLIYNLVNETINFDQFFSDLLLIDNVEKRIDNSIYYEIIELNSNNKDKLFVIINKLKNIANFGKCHKDDIIAILANILEKNGNLIDKISRLNSFANKGYDFLYQLESVANYGEQGKSILVSKNNTYSSIEIYEHNFFTKIKILKNQLINDEIQLTGKVINEYYGEVIFEYQKNT